MWTETKLLNTLEGKERVYFRLESRQILPTYLVSYKFSSYKPSFESRRVHDRQKSKAPWLYCPIYAYEVSIFHWICRSSWRERRPQYLQIVEQKFKKQFLFAICHSLRTQSVGAEVCVVSCCSFRPPPSRSFSVQTTNHWRFILVLRCKKDNKSSFLFHKFHGQKLNKCFDSTKKKCQIVVS